jgi:multidrug efflux system membrane fusion protein
VPALPLFYFSIALLIACLIWLIAFEENGKEAFVTDENRNGGNQAQAEPGVHKEEQHEQEQDQHDDSLRKPKPMLGWLFLGCVVLLASVVVLIAVGRAVENPRTDDAEVFANFIGMAPQVDGPIMQLPIRDNQYVKAGDLLFVVDERPYRYALERALSQQAALEGQIEDRGRSINSQISAVHVAQANISSRTSNRDALNATISEAEANLADSRAALRRAEADRDYAADNLHRLEPLLARQFVTVDQVEQARTLLETRTRAVQQAEAQVAVGEAHVQTTRLHYQQSGADVEQSEAQRDQAANGVETLAPLTNQREERAAAIRTARYNLDNCRVYAPFDGYITDLTTSVGEYVRTGSQMFTMIDSRVWWVVANFRETQLNHVVPGFPADLFLMSHENLPLRGVVEGIGHGVTPDPGVAGVLSPGLPAIERSLSWVHLAARYPVRIRIESPPSSLVRIGQNAVAVVHPANGSVR